MTDPHVALKCWTYTAIALGAKRFIVGDSDAKVPCESSVKAIYLTS
jgi:hypothetical protein